MGEQVTYSQSEAVEETTAGNVLQYLDRPAFDAVRSAAGLSAVQRTALFAQMARFNALYMIARAGSGHLGSSFSSLDIVSWLYLNVLGPHDRYFSSKGHDSPGLYAVHTALGIQPFERIHQLRRLGGLPGHPDIGSPGAVTNTGSLGMGVSKAKGFIAADDLTGKPGGRLFVLTGDGELQEGQFWESLVSASRLRNHRLTVIVDHNKVQSDTFVERVSDLGDLPMKFAAFGWDFRRCDGHDLHALSETLARPSSDGRPVAIVADTVKGQGVSFMAHTAMAADQEYYRYHSGAPAPEEYRRAADELLADIGRRCTVAKLAVPVPVGVKVPPLKPPADAERMIPAYTQAILAEARADARIVALDADLVLDTGLIPFKNEFGPRFVECGIAEQDMVSQAGTMALGGLIPIVHSFSCFLTTRPAEQIYNNCTEGTQVIYVGSLSGLLPAGPGHSHQSVRDVTAMSALPGLAVIEPLCAAQIAPALAWALHSHDRSSYLRLTSIPYVQRPELAGLESLVPGQGHVLRQGRQAIVVVSSPVLVVEALKAADRLQADGRDICVIGMPWLNRFDTDWFARVLPAGVPLFTLENHYAEGGFGVQFIAAMAEAGHLGARRVRRLGLDRVPASGRNDEVLAHHGLDADHLAGIFRTVL
jgi:transketolase